MQPFAIEWIGFFLKDVSSSIGLTSEVINLLVMRYTLLKNMLMMIRREFHEHIYLVQNAFVFSLSDTEEPSETINEPAVGNT